MEKNNGEDLSNNDIKQLEKLLTAHGWDRIAFKRVNPYSQVARELITKVWDFAFGE